MAKHHVAGRERQVGGWRREPPDHRDRLLSKRPQAPRAVPARVDLSSACPRIEDQAESSSCTAHAGTSMHEALYLRDGLPQPELSRMFLYYATRVWVAGWPASEDGGAFLRDTMKAMARYGVAVEQLWPFDLSKVGAKPTATATKDGAKRQIVEYVRCSTLEDLKRSLADGFPVMIGFDVPSSMFGPATEATGVVPLPTSAADVVGGHAVLVVGYDDARGALKFANSWSTRWGDHGYGYLPYAFVTRGFADDFWSARMIESANVQPPAPARRCWLGRAWDWVKG